MLTRISKRGIDLIKQFEGCASKVKDSDKYPVICTFKDIACNIKVYPYICSAGYETIGWGCRTFGKDYRNGLLISDCEKLLLNRIKKEFEEPLQKYLKVKLNQNQYDAIISLCFNLGIYAFSKTRLLKAINKQDFENIKKEWLDWKNDFLLPRRKKELELFFT